MTRIIAAAISTTQTVGSVHQFFVEIREIRVSKRDKLPQLHFRIEKLQSEWLVTANCSDTVRRLTGSAQCHKMCINSSVKAKLFAGG